MPPKVSGTASVSPAASGRPRVTVSSFVPPVSPILPARALKVTPVLSLSLTATVALPALPDTV